MKGVQCGVCESVWLSPVAQELVVMSGGCLRCDGPLRELTEEETAIALQKQQAKNWGAPVRPRPGDR